MNFSYRSKVTRITDDRLIVMILVSRDAFCIARRSRRSYSVNDRSLPSSSLDRDVISG